MTDFGQSGAEKELGRREVMRREVYDAFDQIANLVGGPEEAGADWRVREAMQRVADCHDLDEDTLGWACAKALTTLTIVHQHITAGEAINTGGNE